MKKRQRRGGGGLTIALSAAVEDVLPFQVRGVDDAVVVGVVTSHRVQQCFAESRRRAPARIRVKAAGQSRARSPEGNPVRVKSKTKQKNKKRRKKEEKQQQQNKQLFVLTRNQLYNSVGLRTDRLE